MTEIRAEWFDHNGDLMAFEIKRPGDPTQGYLFHLGTDGRTMLYPPMSWNQHGPMGWLSTRPGEGYDVTSPWAWWSVRKARRIIRRIENRVARSMRTIYREHDQWRRNSPSGPVADHTRDV